MRRGLMILPFDDSGDAFVWRSMALHSELGQFVADGSGDVEVVAGG